MIDVHARPWTTEVRTSCHWTPAKREPATQPITTCMSATSQGGGGSSVRPVPWAIALKINGTTMTPPSILRGRPMT